ncbi:MAG: hypothetical protein ACPG8W_03935 [Candidatus Promineifilaceae bacterium]
MKRSTRLSIPAIYPWVLLTLLVGFIAVPVLQSAIERYTYDAALYHIYRGVIYSEASLDTWFPRWANQLFSGAGSPLFSYYPSLIYFLMDLLHRIGVSHAFAWRIWIAVSFIGGAWGAFGLARTLFRDVQIALACGVLFGYSRYLSIEFFERGSPQGFSIVLIPWLFWMMLLLAEQYKRRYTITGAIVFAAVFWAHNVTALLMLPLVLLWAIWLKWQYGWWAFGRISLMIALGIGVSAFYLFPSLLELGYVRVGADAGYFNVPYSQPAINPFAWSDIVGGWTVYDVGIINRGFTGYVSSVEFMLLVAGAGATWLLFRREQRALASLVGLSTLGGLTIILLQMAVATPFWVQLSFLDNLQVRWRLFSVSGILFVAVAGGVLHVLPRRFVTPAVVVVIVAAMGMQLPSVYPTLQHLYEPVSARPDLAEAEAFMARTQFWELTSWGEFQPRWGGGAGFSAETTPILNLPANTTVTNHIARSNQWQFEIDASAEFQATLALHYFPGWEVRVDGDSQAISPSAETGYIQVTIPAGKHTVVATYAKTSLQQISEAISIGTMLLLAATLIIPKATTAQQPANALAKQTESAAVNGWLLAAITALLLLKTFVIDPHTTIFRDESTCGNVVQADVQTQVQFGSDFWLCGYSLSATTLTPGDTLDVTLYWQTTAPHQGVETFLALFEDIPKLESAFRVSDTSDQAPGGHNVADWMPSRLYVAHNSLLIGETLDLPQRNFQLEVGVWRPATNERLWPTIQQEAPQLEQSNYATIVIRGLTIDR